MKRMPPASTTTDTRAPLREALAGSHWALLGAILLTLTSLSVRGYLLFHTLAELVSIVIAMAAFAVAWSAYPFSRNRFLMYIGIVLFWSGALDLAHMLLYKGMNIFQGTSANEPTQVWIATRYLQAAGFLIAPWILDRPLRRIRVFVVFGTIALALFISIMRGAFPDAFIEGEGLTPFKIASEYIVIAMFVAGIGLLWMRRELLDRTVLILLSSAVGALIIGEFMFTLYVDVYGLSNLAGHLFKVVGYWLIYWALVGFTVEQPFRMMARTASTYDAVPEAIVVVDSAGIVREANRAAASLIGLEPAACVGRDSHEWLHPRCAARSDCPVCAAVKLSAEPVAMELESVGDARWYEFSLSPIRHTDVPVGMVQVRRDITERHRMMQILEESERRFRSLTENSTDLTVVFDRKGVLSYVSPSIGQMAGYEPNELVGRRFIEFIHADDVPAAMEDFASMLRNPGLPVTDELRYRHKNGSWIVLWTRSKNLLDDPTVSGIVVNARDVTEKKEAEARLHKQLDELRRFERVSIGRELRMQQLETRGAGTPGEAGVHGKPASECAGPAEHEPLLDAGEAISDESARRRALLHMLEDLDREREAVERARRQWIDTVDSVSDPMMVHDGQFRVVRANSAYAARAGMGFADIIGRPYWECFPKRAGPLPGCQAIVLKGADPQARYPDEEFFVGDEIFVSRVFRIRDVEKGELLSLHLFEEITERIRSAEALRKNNELLERIFENTHFCVAYLDRNFNFIRVNRAYAETCHRPAEFFPGRNHFDLYPHAENEAIFSRVVATGTPFTIAAKPFKFPDQPERGTTYWDWTLHPLKDGTGAVEALLFVLLDVTERVQAELAREAGEKQLRLFRSLIDKARDEITVVEPESLRILDINEVVCRNLGYSREELLSMRIPDINVPGHLDKDRIETQIRAPGVAIFEDVRRRKDGSTYPVEVTTTAVRFDDKVRAISVARDINERRKADAALRRLNRSLRTLSAGNEALMRAREETELLNEMCRIVVEVGGYAMAWVGYALADPSKSIEPKASVPDLRMALRDAAISWADNERGQAPVAKAIRLGDPQIALAGDPAFTSFRASAMTPAMTAVLGLPLRFEPGERPFGAIGIAAAEGDAFDMEERKLLEELAGDLAYGIASLRAGVERRASAEQLRQSLERTIEAIAATVETRDPYTAGHQRRVARLAVQIGREMGLPQHNVEGIQFGALIHDLGKIQVPAEILAKPSRLNPIEREFIKNHAQAGYDIIKGIQFPWPVAEMVLQHHERLDGSGYPKGLKRGEIALEARILAVADTVEAMASHRPYRPGFGIQAALDEITKRRGCQYDEQAVDACVKLFKEKGWVFTQ